MKQLIILVICLFSFVPVIGQVKTHQINPKAVAYYKEALDKYGKAVSNRDSMKVVMALIDKSLAEDGRYYSAWGSKVAFECQLEQYKKACQSIKKMAELFPNDIFVEVLYGSLQIKNGLKSDAEITLNKALKLCNTVPDNVKKNAVAFNDVQTNKGIIMILLDRPGEGKHILKSLYNAESEPAVKSHLAYYINSTTKNEVIDEVIPGKWQ